MKKLLIYIPILTLIFVFYACTNNSANASSDIEYLDELNQSLQTIITNISDLNDYVKVSNLDDEKWTSDFKIKINDISTSIEKVSNINFPDDKQELKKSYDDIIKNLNTGFDDFKLSCDTKNIDDFNKGVNCINTSIENIKTLDDKIK